ncbi:MAG: PAS domain S-box protein [Ktedonobacterales bacterium]
MPNKPRSSIPRAQSSEKNLSVPGLSIGGAEPVSDGEARFRALVQATGQIYWIADAEGQLTISDGWSAFTGQTPEEASGDGWTEAIHPDDRASTVAEWKVAVVRRQPYRQERRMRRTDGDYRIMLGQAYPVLLADGNVHEWVGAETDVTLLKELHTYVADGQEEFRITFELAAVGIAHVHPEDGRILRANQKLSQILGYTPEELVGRKFQELTYPPDLDANLSLFERLLASEISVYTLEKRYIRKDRTLVWANLTASLKRDQSGNPQLGIAVVEDITERRLLKEELSSRAQELEAIFASMTDGLLVLGTDGGVLRHNPAYADLVGWPDSSALYEMPTDERLRALHIRDAAGEAIPLHQLATRRVLQGETVAEDQILRRRDGRDVYVQTRGSPLTGSTSSINGAVIVVHDDSLRRALEDQTKEALSALLRMAELLVEYPPESGEQRSQLVERHLAELACSLLGCPAATIITLDPHTLAMHVAGTVGYTAEQEKRLDSVVASWTYAPPDLAEIARLMAGETLILDVTQSVPREQAAFFGVNEVLAAPMRLGSRLIGMIIFNPSTQAHTFTPQQVALAGATAKMVGLVVERERLLHEREDAYAYALALQESNRQMDTFLGMVSHELRTPLASLKLSVQAIRRRLERAASGPLDAENNWSVLYAALEQLLAGAERQTLRLERLLEDLLDASRVKEGQLALRLETADLNGLVQAVVADQQQLTPKRLIQLSTPAASQLEVQMDKDLIKQAVANYLTNALKYSASERPVLVGVEQEAGEARVWVRDQGPGIALADQERIWERFQRVPGIEEQNDTVGGLGLGLYVTKMLVEQHQGRVGIISAPGQGSTFWLSLPLAQQ